MVRIRMSRGGCKKRPFYFIVVADQRKKTSFIEKIGFLNPLMQLNVKNSSRIDWNRLSYWSKRGATMSHRIQRLVLTLSHMKDVNSVQDSTTNAENNS